MKMFPNFSRPSSWHLISLLLLSGFVLDLQASNSKPSSSKVEQNDRHSLELLHALAQQRNMAGKTLSLADATAAPAQDVASADAPASAAAPPPPKPVDCSGQPGGCFGTNRATHQLLPLIIFGFIGAGFYWSYLRFVYPEQREKKAVPEQPRTVVFAPSQKIYDTFGHENAPNLV
mmetsp:Transcript_3899/g.9624  ORF Transcript_3899/g.9624 Transcript_3899/m.9624 type:complete len:175 (-) Transcript_3899:17-541(-)